MPRTEFIATAFHVPERVVTNDDLAQLMDTSDEWIVQRSGIKTRYWVSNGETGASLATAAARKALAQAGMRAAGLDGIVYCTCTPDHCEPGNGVFLERELGLTDIPAIDVRNQCSGFIYGLSVADAWIRIGQYRRILLVGAEVHSRGLDRTTRGRDTAVLFGDGAGVAILGPTDDPARGVLSTHLFADGRHAEDLWVDAPGLAHDPYISESLIRQGKHRAVMDGREVFKSASVLMPQSVAVALAANGLARPTSRCSSPTRRTCGSSRWCRRRSACGTIRSTRTFRSTATPPPRRFPSRSMKRCAQGAWRGGIYSSSPPSGRDSPGRARRCAGSASAARFRLQLLELPRRGLSVGRPAIPLGEPRQLHREPVAAAGPPVQIDQRVRRGELPPRVRAAASRLEILLLRALGVREVALVQLRQPQPRVAVGRIHPQVVAEVLGRFGILPLRDQHVLVGIQI